MQTPRFRLLQWARRRLLRGANAVALSLALVAALASCDEKATNTEPASPTGLSGADISDPSLDEAALISQEGVGALAIPLPVNQTVTTTSPAPAFRVNQTGTGPNGIFQITRVGNTQTALQGLTNGRGRAGFFQIRNRTNDNHALEVQTNGTGRAGFFQIQNTANDLPALDVRTNGTGRAGFFQIQNTETDQPALDVQTNGAGAAVTARTTGFGDGGVFVVDNTRGVGTALFAISNAFGGALTAVQNGQGRGAAFSIENASNNRPVLQVGHDGVGLALLVTRGASRFDGDVDINGTLTKDAGSFKIDHPLDPEHKYLSHSFVESPDMMNVYNGNVTLDASGRATVELPDYFEALNREFRYQLTAVGAPGPNLYIAEGVKQNRFQIAGGRPYAQVSWQVTGVRHDTYANEHRIRVEEEKPREEKPGVERELVARR